MEGRVAASAEKRVALVIGNALYKHADPLKNPVNDARAIGAALTRLGFTGTKPRLNLDYDGLRQALQAFGVEADGADMAVLYFAGHGVEVDGRNFLIPVDAKLERPKSVDFQTASLDQALNAVDGARQLRLIILDACRNSPFRARMLGAGGARSIGTGLRSIEPGGNVLVAYAAKHGTVALDGKGGNSPYAEALLSHIEKPGIEIGKLFREIRDDVLTRTGNAQEPYTYGSLGRDDVYLKPPHPVASEPEKPRAPESAAPEPPWLRHPLLLAVVSGIGASFVALAAVWMMQQTATECSSTDWDRVENRQNLEALQKFAADCQQTTYGIFAKEELEKRDKADWDQVWWAGMADAYRGYIERWDKQRAYQGKFVAQAKAALVAASFTRPPAADNQTEQARPDADRRAKADDAAFAKVKQSGTKAALTGYLKYHPQGRNVTAARAELIRLDFVEVPVGATNEIRWVKAGGGKDDDETFKDCEDCARMVVVPGGRFMMGSPDTEKDGNGDEEPPQHQVAIATPFAVGKFEVSFAEWDACVTDKGCTYKPEAHWGRGTQPVINVSWDDITKEYLPWLSKKTGKTYRLLTEAEWEYAARAKTTGPFSFDGKITTDKANYNGDYSYDGSPKGEYRAETVPVKSFAPNAWGLYQVHGNVREWVQDCYAGSYKEGAGNGGPAKEPPSCARVLRGGSWKSLPSRLRSASRNWDAPDDRNGVVGFRVARTLSPF